jgi:hypothetical protein
MLRSSLPPALALLAACSGPPTPAPTPLDELAAKPAEVRAKLERAQAEQLDRLKRQDPEATQPTPDAEPQR